MTTEQKIIRAKFGLLELAKQLGNVCSNASFRREITSALKLGS